MNIACLRKPYLPRTIRKLGSSSSGNIFKKWRQGTVLHIMVLNNGTSCNINAWRRISLSILYVLWLLLCIIFRAESLYMARLIFVHISCLSYVRDMFSVSRRLIPPEPNGRHFADDVFRCIFVNEVFFLITISQTFVLKGPVDDNSALV